jgi:hypothetical protein
MNKGVFAIVGGKSEVHRAGAALKTEHRGLEDASYLGRSAAGASPVGSRSKQGGLRLKRGVTASLCGVVGKEEVEKGNEDE